jgi:hypothetical protein
VPIPRVDLFSEYPGLELLEPVWEIPGVDLKVEDRWRAGLVLCKSLLQGRSDAVWALNQLFVAARALDPSLDFRFCLGNVQSTDGCVYYPVRAREA